MKLIFASIAFVFLQACAVMGTSPESQLAKGAQTHTAATSLATALLERRKITTAQAVDYRAMLGTANTALDGSAKRLTACRTLNSGAPAKPDPCALSVSADVNLALSVLTEIERTLLAQEAATK